MTFGRSTAYWVTAGLLFGCLTMAGCGSIDSPSPSSDSAQQSTPGPTVESMADDASGGTDPTAGGRGFDGMSDELTAKPAGESEEATTSQLSVVESSNNAPAAPAPETAPAPDSRRAMPLTKEAEFAEKKSEARRQDTPEALMPPSPGNAADRSNPADQPVAETATALGGYPGAADKPEDKSEAFSMGHAFRVNSFDSLGVANESKLNEQQRRTLQLDLQPGEELWVIAKATVVDAKAVTAERPGCGALMATLPKATQQVPVPLKHTAVTGNIDGYIATVDVTQQFHNPYDSKIEAVYVFPLPHNAAVNEFVMTVGDRKIRGIIREREKAEQIYAAAKQQGHVASLMTQERPNIFTQKVANIEPGKQIDINIRYFNTLQYDDGAYEFVFPMVVGPRYNPPASTDGVGAVARGQHGTSGQQTEVQYLAPNERSGHDVSLSLNIAAGVDIEAVDSVNHIVDVKETSECERAITLSAADSIPNKDFVLRYKVAGKQIKTAMLTHQDKHGSYFTMMLYPPADLEQVQRSPMEMVFVLDCSGSMRGKPLTQAKDAISHALQSLTERDTFQIIQFSSNASQLGAEPVLATEDNIKRGLKYLASLNGGGGTQMIEGIKAALDFPHDEGRFRLVSFMTDGFIGNEQQILGTLHDKLGASRVFSFGVGSSPNRYLMDRMAVLGRGAVAYLSLNDDAVQIMDRFNRRISHPAMTDLAIDWGQMEVADVYPERLPDLIVGRPVIITGRYKGEPGTVKVNGRVDLQPTSFEVALNEQDAAKSHAGIAAVWARLKIKDMLNYSTHAPEAAEEVKTAVTQTALAYNLMSSFTAFVAVDSMTQTEGEFGTTVAVPVPVPAGVKYETTVGTGGQ
ncbi:MAG: VIT domain-containing protein [Planctomycetaceae bacterium]